MARKQQHSNKSKGRKTAKAVVQTSRPQASASSHKHDFWTAALTVLSLVIVQVTLVLHADNADPVNAYLSSQASAGSFYINTLAVLSTAYGKATANFHVNGHTYLLSMLGYVLVAHIFAQAVFMVYPDVPLYAEFMRSEWFSIAGHLLLFGIIFAIACTKGVPDFTKETIKRQ
jgi:hypothetical protein